MRSQIIETPEYTDVTSSVTSLTKRVLGFLGKKVDKPKVEPSVVVFGGISLVCIGMALYWLGEAEKEEKL